jgi:polysaccharide pyruvyl transferase WcaK-like protein
MKKCDIPGDLVFEKGNGPILGVNLSPLSFLHVYAKEDMAAAFQEHIDALETLISELSVRVILIPHVIAPHMPRDDDYRFLKSIYDIISERHPDYIALLSPDLGAQRTKGVISHCDALLASRMHCGIAAVSQGIPTLFLSYSSKARGMAQYVYGDDTFCLGLNEAVGNTLVTRTRLLLDSRTQIASALSSRMEEFADMAKQGGRILKCRFRTE